MPDDKNIPLVHWFGESWGAGVCDERFHEPTPIGQRCVRCEVAIEEGDRGLFLWHGGVEESGYLPYHLDCILETLGLRDAPGVR